MKLKTVSFLSAFLVSCGIYATAQGTPVEGADCSFGTVSTKTGEKKCLPGKWSQHETPFVTPEGYGWVCYLDGNLMLTATNPLLYDNKDCSGTAKDYNH